MKFIHIADLHFSKNYEKAKKALQSMKEVTKYAKDHKVDGVLIAGDIWDAPILNTDSTYFNRYVLAIQDLAEHCPIFMIQGTVTHDADGSLDIFQNIKSNNRVWVLSQGDYVYENPFVVFGIPEIQKSQIEGDAKEYVNKVFEKVAEQKSKYPETPSILIYHGQVTGAKINDNITIGESDHIPTVEHFKSLGVDYIAMGDIHLPQKLDGVEAYYSGSIYPCNWGETHQCGFNVIDIDRKSILGRVTVERVDFSHHQQVKKSMSITELDNVNLNLGAYEYLMWIEFIGTEDEFNARAERFEQVKQQVKGVAVNGSRVTFSVIPSEKVRVKEIAETKSILGKVKLWFDSYNHTFTEDMVNKVEMLENEFKNTGNFHKLANFRVNKLVLRGAIGLWKKSKLNEITIDLESIPTGLVSLIGSNGSGKTTIIENMHPWSCVFTRDGKLSDNFRLRDSMRDLYITDEETGIEYRCLMNINAGIQNPTIEYYMYYRVDGSKWNMVEGITGRKEAYDTTVDRIFGTMEMYQRSAFIKQKSTKNLPELAESTRSQRMDLLTELCGFDYLETYKKLANKRFVACDEEYKDYSNKIAYAQVNPETIELLESEAKKAHDTLSMSQSGLLLLTHKVNSMKQKLDILLQSEKDQSKVKNEIVIEQSVVSNYTIKINQLANEIEDLDLSSEVKESLIQSKETYLRELSTNEDIKKRNESAYAEYRKLCAEIDSQNRVIDDTINSIKSDLDKCRMSHLNMKIQIKEITEEIKSTELRLESFHDTCPMCKQKLQQTEIDKINSEKESYLLKVTQLKHLLFDKDHSCSQCNKEINRLEESLIHLNKRKRELPTRPIDIDSVKTTITASEYEQTLSILAKIDGSSGIIEAKRNEMVSLNNLILESQSKMNDLSKKLDNELDTLIIRTNSEMVELNNQWRNSNDTTIKLRTELEGLNKTIQKNKDEMARLETLRMSLKTLKLDMDEWSLLVEAFGSKGTQALELDAIAPNISMIANSILREAYGEKYTIQLKTTRQGGTGKTIEDVLIMIYDNDDGTEQELSTLSGGETVWINKALHDAFAIIRSQNSGISFATAFYDESDGKLDPESKEFYMRMTQEAHTRSKRHHTIIISHDQSVQAMIPNRIYVSSLK